MYTDFVQQSALDSEFPRQLFPNKHCHIFCCAVGKEKHNSSPPRLTSYLPCLLSCLNYQGVITSIDGLRSFKQYVGFPLREKHAQHVRLIMEYRYFIEQISTINRLWNVSVCGPSSVTNSVQSCMICMYIKVHGYFQCSLLSRH